MITIDVGTHGNHPTLGLMLLQNATMNNRPQLQECAKSTPAARIPKWRSTLRRSFPITINGKRITSEQDVVPEV